MAKIAARGATEVGRFDTGNQRFVFCSDGRLLIALKYDGKFGENKLFRRGTTQDQWEKFRSSFKTCQFCGHLRQKCAAYTITEPDFQHKDYREGMPPGEVPQKSHCLDICPECRLKQQAADQAAGLNPQ